MSAPEKAEVVTKVSSSPLPKRKVLRDLGIPKSTYYRWLRRQNQQGLARHLRTDQEAISHHGTVLLFRKNAQSCYQPERCQS